jgi:hypothetical protein
VGSKKTGLQKLGHGVFEWDGSERRSDRYGSFFLDAKAPEGLEAKCSYDMLLAEKLEGKRVHIVAVVIATCTSTHIGDMFLKIKPSTPEVGEVVDLGVGVFHCEPCVWDRKLFSVSLIPDDKRKTFWFDPRKLYRLHDQTVDVFVEETRAAFSAVPDVYVVDTDAAMVSTGDGNFQTKHVEPENLRVFNKVERLGDGLLSFTPACSLPKGERVRFEHRGKKS